MTIDELTVEASVPLLHVIDAPADTAAAKRRKRRSDEGEEELIEAADDSAPKAKPRRRRKPTWMVGARRNLSTCRGRHAADSTAPA